MAGSRWSAISQDRRHSLILRSLRDTWGSVLQAGVSAGGTQVSRQVGQRQDGLASSSSVLLLSGSAGSARQAHVVGLGGSEDSQPTRSSPHGVD